MPADADVIELIHADQERNFMEESGLASARPDAHIRFSRPVGYLELLENVQLHGYHLLLEAGRSLAREEIAADWYDDAYAPTVEAIRAEGLERAYPGATEADFFLCVYYGRRELKPEAGCLPLAETARRMREDANSGGGRLRRLAAAAVG